MKRTTVTIPDELAAALEREARRRRVPVSQITREALAAHLRLDGAAPTPEVWPRIAELVERYEDFPLGGADASVVALAERIGTDLIVTLDRRHFAAIRPRHCAAFQLLPD